MEIISRVRKIFGVMGRGEKLQLWAALAAMIVSGLVDMAGIVSMVPFLTAVADVDNIENVGYLSWAYEYFGFTGIRPFLIALALLSLSLLVINNATRIGTTWLSMRVSMRIRHTLYKNVYEYFLTRPYTFYIEKNTAELVDKMTNRVNSIVAGTLTPGLIIITNGLTGALIFVTLLWQDFLLTISLIVTLAFFYLLVYRFVQREIVNYGKEVTRIDPIVLKLANESFGGIKELKTLGREASFIRRLSSLSWDYSVVYLKIRIIQAVPGALVELIAIGTIVLIGSYLIYVYDNLSEVLPVLGVYVIASRRIQPAMQSIFMQIGQIKLHQPSFDVIWPDIEAAFAEKQNRYSASDNYDAIDLREGIEIENLVYAYDKANKKVIDQLNLSIPALSTVGIVGGSGVGKTTLVDLILGLLKPDSGQIVVDGRVLEMGSKTVGYVPQNVYLADDTVMRNIAFGLDDEEIDKDAVSRAAELAQVSAFIEAELTDKYDTIIGEQGIRLSGGQRQRLGIARALYHNPSVLILDEATSSLDGITEQSFMRAVRDLSQKKTIVIIAHRLTTLKDCDIIYLLGEGRVVDRGTYGDLIKNNAQFARMANEDNEIKT
jgi:ATP-binding cassette, subfamily B, bacterial PglK